MGLLGVVWYKHVVRDGARGGEELGGRQGVVVVGGSQGKYDGGRSEGGGG